MTGQPVALGNIAEPLVSARTSAELVSDFSAWMASEQRRIFAMCQRLLQDQDEADSATQDVFFKAYQALVKEDAKDLEDPVVGVLIRNRLGIDVFGTNTRIEGVELGRVAAGETFEVEFGFDCLLTRQDYTLTVATQYREGFSQDWLDDVISFSVVDARDVAGLANFKTKVNWRRVTA